LTSGTSLTFYGGVHEIGGNKFLIEDKGTKVFLDFGMQMGKANDYFFEYLKPRALNGMTDLFEFGLLPNLKGLYRQDYTVHTNLDDKKEAGFDAVLLSHAHMDHAAYIHFLRPDIPIYCSEATKIILQGLQDTGGREEYVTFKEHFQIYENKNGQMIRGDGEEYQKPRDIHVFQNENFSIDSIEVEPLVVDHSLPGVTGFILYTSKGSVAYTADIRFHGRRPNETKKFVERCDNSHIDFLLCEGTRINETFSETEFKVEKDVGAIVAKTKNLIVCTYPARDLDRMLSFYNVAKSSERDLVIDLKQAYLLKLFQKSEKWKSMFPRPGDRKIKIFLPRKSWGLVGRDNISSYWTERQLMHDYDPWEREFIDYPNAVTYQEISSHQKDFIFYCNDYALQQLIDVRPLEGSRYIRSQTEPFDEEMEIKEERVKKWIEHFRLISSEKDWTHTHVSGHGSGDQIKKVIEGSKAKTLIPIHTEHEEYHKKWHPQVIDVQLNDSIII
jgi:ribonuclease J